ncbi:L-2-amino-thiazoline-4-carboxylic acid hydrolase [Roseomonas sp. CCTCC AB2023176]|uniref:L-2-amino-thiazoline-4-carboxylic acid hydrolase n=1 Tax=Roseomonas sp. CCTCC AB2023176 TaxID=3342640 RepID=UPI0035DBF9BD
MDDIAPETGSASEWREVPSPALPAREPSAEERAARLAAELDAAFKARARLYRDLLVTLEEAVGAAEAERLLGLAIRRRGDAAGAALFAAMGDAGPAAVVERFLTVASPDWGRLFPHAVSRRGDGGVRVTVRRCPLKEAWVEDGLAPAEIARLCRIAGEADHGVFGRAGCGFSAETWAPGRQGCCVLTFTSHG